ncbi:MAG TPA: 2Fe-2S iron-sulfur cluster binding domain-containing protein, partial [Nocardioides sp.]|nr:2Fe-2S iron-sulfur cluster binding domain-containing protein [Nocardioides sp.]
AAEDAASAQPQEPVSLEVELDGENYSFDDWMPGTKLLEHLESKGIKAPFSCREGECSACACRVLEGEVKMINNDVLDEEDLAEGIRLGCQSLPVTDKVSITYH